MLGHMVWGYILSRLVSKGVRVKTPPYALLLASVVPDFDLYFLHLGLAHHTYSHSIIIWTPIFLVLLACFGLRSIPYVVGISQHFLVTDFLVGRVPLLLPVSKMEFGLGLGSTGRNEMVLEVGAFVVAALVAYQTGDLQEALTIGRENLRMIFPLFALVSLTLLFANETGVNLLNYGFASGSISLISVSHILLASFLALSFVQGLRSLGQRKVLSVATLTK